MGEKINPQITEFCLEWVVNGSVNADLHDCWDVTMLHVYSANVK